MKNIEIIDKNKNLTFEKVNSVDGTYRKSYCKMNLGTVNEELTKQLNPSNLDNAAWYDKHNIKSDIFDVRVDGELYRNHTLSNGKIIKVHF